ncbi:MAG: ABC transporter permease [Gammaproteobacteria bacterium]|nr:ABC transporter permease [Gammaproteobacteria bacterium]
MYILNLSKQILRDMWARKLRSILALFGVMWGTLTVILLLSIGQGFQQASQKNIMQLADGAFFAIPRTTSKSYRGFPKGQSIKIKADTIANLPKNVPFITAATPILQNFAAISYNNGKQTEKVVYGVSEDLLKLRKLQLVDRSRFFNPLDIKNSNRVVILGNKVKTQLFKDENPLGKTIFINHVQFLVVGAIKKTRQTRHDWYDDNLLIPYTTYKALWGDQDVVFFAVLPDRAIPEKQAENALKTYLGFKYHFDKTDEVGLRIFSTTKIFTFFKWFFIAVQLFLGACGALTLGVGSLGVANIMFLIVTERTKEIGIRMAVGAKQWHIFLQILLEALLIVGLGAFLGFFISYIVVETFYYISLPDWLGQPQISSFVVFITIAILAVLGSLSGFFPARRAARMDPIDALGFGG